MPSLQLAIPSWYLSMTGGFWGISGLIVAYGLFRGRTWAPGLLLWGGLAFSAWFWIDRILYVRTDFGRGNWPAVAALTLLILGTLVWTLKRSDIKAYFQERDV
jgi:hypothetical protein